MLKELNYIITSCYNNLSLKNKEIIDFYYGRNETNSYGYTEIAYLYGDTRQNIESIIRRFRSNITKILTGGVYKQIAATEDMLLWYSQAISSLSSYKYISSEAFMAVLGFTISESFYMNIAYDLAGFHLTHVESYATILHAKNIPMKTIENLIYTISSVLNDEVFWIDQFDLIIQINKRKSQLITLPDFKTISKTMHNIEFDPDDKVRLKYAYLSSIEKKAMRILEDKNEPAHKDEIFQELISLEPNFKSIYKIESLVNVLSDKKSNFKSVGKTGLWILNKYDFDLRNQADVIQWAFHEKNSNCEAMTANEIYSKVCLSRKDLRIEVINSYLYTLNDRFIPIGDGKFILNAWKKRYQKEINAYEKKKYKRSTFDLVVRNSLSDGKPKTLKEIVTDLRSEHIFLSEGRIATLLKNDYIESFKEHRKLCYKLKISVDDNRLAFLKVIKDIILEIKNGIENRKAYGAFYNHNDPKSESHVQIEIYERMRGYLKAEDIDITREPFTGLGPADFKFSMGYKLRVFMELKLASNPNVIEGLNAQLTQYMGSEVVKLGIFTVVILSDDDFDKISLIEENIKDIETKYSMHIEYVIIDARKNLSTKSPSQLKSGEERIIKELIQ